MHINSYLQPCPGYGWSGGPEFKTQIVELQNGRERRNAMWADARHKYTAPFQNIDKQAYMSIKKMHLVCRGMLHAFRFVDELDFEAESEIFGIPDGVKKTFQFEKISTISGVSYRRNIYALQQGVIIKVNGNVISTGFTVDYDRGLVTFNVAPAIGSVLTWSGFFDIWVRFAQDDLPFSIDELELTNGSVSLVEVPPPAIVI